MVLAVPLRFRSSPAGMFVATRFALHEARGLSLPPKQFPDMFIETGEEAHWNAAGFTAQHRLALVNADLKTALCQFMGSA